MTIHPGSSSAALTIAKGHAAELAGLTSIVEDLTRRVTADAELIAHLKDREVQGLRAQHLLDAERNITERHRRAVSEFEAAVREMSEQFGERTGKAEVLRDVLKVTHRTLYSDIPF